MFQCVVLAVCPSVFDKHLSGLLHNLSSFCFGGFVKFSVSCAFENLVCDSFLGKLTGQVLKTKLVYRKQ